MFPRIVLGVVIILLTVVDLSAASGMAPSSCSIQVSGKTLDILAPNPSLADIYSLLEGTPTGRGNMQKIKRAVAQGQLAIRDIETFTEQEKAKIDLLRLSAFAASDSLAEFYPRHNLWAGSLPTIVFRLKGRALEQKEERVTISYNSLIVAAEILIHESRHYFDTLEDPFVKEFSMDLERLFELANLQDKDESEGLRLFDSIEDRKDLASLLTEYNAHLEAVQFIEELQSESLCLRQLGMNFILDPREPYGLARIMYNSNILNQRSKILAAAQKFNIQLPMSYLPTQQDYEALAKQRRSNRERSKEPKD